MKRIIKVSAFLVPTSIAYIYEYRKFNISCEILRISEGIFLDSYVILLQGKEKDIEMFIDYLKSENFRIK